MVVIVWADLLNQSVVCAVEGNVDTNDLKGFGTDPGHMALCLLLEAGLGGVIVAE